MQKPDGSWDVLDDYVIDFALERRRSGAEVAIVTVIGIDGSSPRYVGAQMAVASTGECVGYLSGGCFERAVVAEAREALRLGRDRTVRFGRGSRFLDIQLPCGSAIDVVFATKVPTRLLSYIQDAIESRSTITVSLPYEDHAGGQLEIKRRYVPRRRLALIGIGPAAVQLAKLASEAGFTVVLYSPDELTRTLAACWNVHIVPILSASNLPEIEVDGRTAVVFMLHEHEWEIDFLPSVLTSSAFYIGAMGSRKTHAERADRLRTMGVAKEKIDRLHGPAGTYSGAKNANDIALSILAEIGQVDQESASDPMRSIDDKGSTVPLSSPVGLRSRVTEA